MDQRSRFINEWLRGYYSITDLCAGYAISRKTGYEWINRFDEEGRRGLIDQSRAPHHCPHRITPDVAQLLCKACRRHPDWGPAKLINWLEGKHPLVSWPAASTAGDLLARRGPVKKRRMRRPHLHPGVVPPVTHEPNDLWTADFKGQFRTRDGLYCYPLTIADLHTRCLLTCHGLRSTKSSDAQSIFEHAFRTYGLPRAIRTDNGIPFATTAIQGFSQLNVWWLRLGIQHQRILPASPSRTELINACIKRSSEPPLGRPAPTAALSSVRSIPSEPNSTPNGRMMHCRVQLPVHATAHHLESTRAGYHRRNIQVISLFRRSPRAAHSVSTTA